jgi:hypothetical protein
MRLEMRLRHDQVRLGSSSAPSASQPPLIVATSADVKPSGAQIPPSQRVVKQRSLRRAGTFFPTRLGLCLMTLGQPVTCHVMILNTPHERGQVMLTNTQVERSDVQPWRRALLVMIIVSLFMCPSLMGR